VFFFVVDLFLYALPEVNDGFVFVINFLVLVFCTFTLE